LFLIFHLTFGSDFNQKINFEKIPKLEELTIDAYYKYRGTIPKNIKIIIK